MKRSEVKPVLGLGAGAGRCSGSRPGPPAPGR